MFSWRRPSKLALQAAFLLAQQRDGSTRRVRDLADELGVGTPYLAKVLQPLTRRGILHAVRGPGGGLQLGQAAREIYLWDILCGLEGTEDMMGCFLGLPQCSDHTPCPMRHAWLPIRAQILLLLQGTSLAEIAAGADIRRFLKRELQVIGTSPSRQEDQAQAGDFDVKRSVSTPKGSLGE